MENTSDFMGALGIERDPWQFIGDSEYVLFEQFRRGVRMHWPTPDGAPKPPERVEGAVIRDMSTKARLRAAHAFGNAVCDWGAMSLLTWRTVPTDGAVHLAWERMRRSWRERWGESMDAWVMEMTHAGRPHFHLFHATESNFGLECRAADSHTIPALESQCAHGCCRRDVRKVSTEPTEIVRGSPDRWLRFAWMEAIGASDCAASLAFNKGGIIERVRTPEAAGRYLSKEAGKRIQKKLPEHYSHGLGRWWYLAKRWQPVGTHAGMLRRDRWPFPGPLKHVFEPECLCDGVVDTHEIRHE